MNLGHESLIMNFWSWTAIMLQFDETMHFYSGSFCRPSGVFSRLRGVFSRLRGVFSRLTIVEGQNVTVIFPSIPDSSVLDPVGWGNFRKLEEWLRGSSWSAWRGVLSNRLCTKEKRQKREQLVIFQYIFRMPVSNFIRLKQDHFAIFRPFSQRLAFWKLSKSPL